MYEESDRLFTGTGVSSFSDLNSVINFSRSVPWVASQSFSDISLKEESCSEIFSSKRIFKLRGSGSFFSSTCLARCSIWTT